MKHGSWRLWRAACAAAGLAVLVGCASPSKWSVQPGRTLGEDEGAVVLRAISNGRHRFDAFEDLSNVTLRRERPTVAGEPAAAPEFMFLFEHSDETLGTRMFARVVPPGVYRVVSFNSVSFYTFPLENVLNRFEVKAGEVTRLGTIILQALDSAGGADRRIPFNVGYLQPDASFEESFQSLFPALEAQVRGRPSSTLDVTPELLSSIAATPRYKEMSRVLNRIDFDATGDIYAGGRGGRIVWRHARDGKWRRAFLPTWKDVSTVRSYRGGLLAAGEEGLLQHSTDDGKTWTPLVTPGKGVFELAEPLTNGKVVAIMRRGSQWTLSITDDVFRGQWKILKTYTHAPQRRGGPTLMAARMGNQAYLAAPDGTVLVVDGETDSVVQHSLGQPILSFKATHAGVLVARGSTLPYPTLLSTDAGATWTDLGERRSIVALAFANRQKMYAVAYRSPGRIQFKYALMRSLDGGQTWEQTGEYPGEDIDAITQLHVDPSDGSLLAVLRYGAILRSADEGKTWVTGWR